MRKDSWEEGKDWKEGGKPRRGGEIILWSEKEERMEEKEVEKSEVKGIIKKVMFRELEKES